MTCPNCRRKLTVEHLRESVECSRAMASAVGIYSLSKRITPPKAGSGRPIVLRPCPVCQQLFGARAIREHIRSHNCSCGTGARGECIVHSREVKA